MHSQIKASLYIPLQCFLGIHCSTAQTVFAARMERFLLLEIFVLSVLLLSVSTSSRADQREICVGARDSSDCGSHFCDSVQCITENITESTVIRFVSTEFLLNDVLSIRNQIDIWLQGSSISGHKAKIICPDYNPEDNNNQNGIGFFNIHNLTISNISIENCGWSWKKGSFQSAVFIIGTTNIIVTDIHILKSTGSGLAIINSNGTVSVSNSCFESNGKTMNLPYVIGGGLYLQMTDCPLGSKDCDNLPSLPNTTTQYTISYCRFLHNINYREPDYEVEHVSRAPIGRGGGLAVMVANGATGNSITIHNCTFINNTALRGGGMYILIRDFSQNNQLRVQQSWFEQNSAPQRAGGGVDMGYIFHPKEQPKGNVIEFSNTTFVNNSASFGGGISIQSSANTERRVSENNFVFNNCTWEKNKAFFAAAIDVSMYAHGTFPHGFLSSALFIDCTIRANVVEFNETTNGSITQFPLGGGAFLATAYTIEFRGNTKFVHNNGTALYMDTSTAVFDSGSIVVFEKNEGLKGGALTLIGLSAINVKKDSSFYFTENRAGSSKGAAIYSYSTDRHEFFAGSTNCFIKRDGESHSESESSIRFVFRNNQAAGSVETAGTQSGQDIRSTTLNQCRRMCQSGDDTNDPSKIFRCIGNFTFSNETISSVTSGASFYTENITLPLKCIPGEEFEVPFKVKDDLGNFLSSVYHVRVIDNSSGVVIDPAYKSISSGRLKLYGMPGEKAQLIVTKSRGRPIAVRFEVELEHCPPGYDIHNITDNEFPLCVCTINTKSRLYGIAWCNSTSYLAYAIRGRWFGYDNQFRLYTSHCPSQFCDSDNKGINNQMYSLIPEASKKKLDKAVCSSKRTGIVCGRCIPNYSASYHSYNFHCVKDDMCRYGPILYITTELLPLTILFVVVIFFNISFTTGTASGFIFFAQIIDSFVVNAHGNIWLNPVVYKFSQAYKLVYRSFNFDFFSNKIFGFCLIKGASALDMLAFKYVTILYAFIMIFGLVFLLNYCNAYFYHKYACLIKHTFKNSIVHSLTTFLIMCYTQCIRVSFLLLTPTTIFGRGGDKVRQVVFRNGEIDYFSKAHLPYAIPALLFLTMALVTPILLVIYPLHNRVIAALKLDNKQWFVKVSKYISLEKMKPLLDSFQSCFKDNCRFFAGLYFFYRFLFLLTFTILAAESFTIFYAVIEVQLVAILALHAHVQPFQKKLHNRLDTLIFTNLAIINALSFLNYSLVVRTGTSSDDMFRSTVDVSSAIQLVLIILPICIVAGYVVYYLIKKWRPMLKRESKTGADEDSDNAGLELPERLLYPEECESEISTSAYTPYTDGQLSD